jgi:hypothetical protein
VGFSMSVSGECPAFLDTWPLPGYRYIGGLERGDNHGRDGVNVLHYDWHVAFDDRSFPSPLGWNRRKGGSDTNSGDAPNGVWDTDDVWQKAYWKRAGDGTLRIVETDNAPPMGAPTTGAIPINSDAWITGQKPGITTVPPERQQKRKGGAQ